MQAAAGKWLGSRETDGVRTEKDCATDNDGQEPEVGREQRNTHGGPHGAYKISVLSSVSWRDTCGRMPKDIVRSLQPCVGLAMAYVKEGKSLYILLLCHFLHRSHRT